jgi:hypothetical protein
MPVKELRSNPRLIPDYGQHAPRRINNENVLSPILEKIGSQFSLAVRTILGSGYSVRSSVASQRPDRAGLVPLNIKHSRQSCHPEQLVYLIAQVYEPKLSTLIPNGCMSPNQLAYS